MQAKSRLRKRANFRSLAATGNFCEIVVGDFLLIWSERRRKDVEKVSTPTTFYMAGAEIGMKVEKILNSQPSPISRFEGTIFVVKSRNSFFDDMTTFKAVYDHRTGRGRIWLQ